MGGSVQDLKVDEAPRKCVRRGICRVMLTFRMFLIPFIPERTNAEVFLGLPFCSSPGFRPQGRPHQGWCIPAEQALALLLAKLHAPITHLVKPKDNIELANIAKERIEDLDEEVNRLEICQFVVVVVDADAEEKPRVPPVHYPVCATELDKIGLMFLISRRNEAVNLSSKVRYAIGGVHGW